MGGARVRRRGYEFSRFTGEIENIERNIEEKQELGNDYEKTKEKLDAKAEEIKNNEDISTSDKKKILTAIQKSLETIQQEYEENVVDEIEVLLDTIESVFEDMKEAAEKLKETEDSLRSTQLDVDSTDLNEAADEAAAEQEKFIRVGEQKQNEIDLQMQELERQKRFMIRKF